LCCINEENNLKMKKILHIVILFIFSFSAFGQSTNLNTSEWENSSKIITSQVELKMYPNPCTNQKLTIETTNNELSEIRITNITGKVVLLRNYELPINKVDLILQNAPNGIYLVQIKTTANKIISKKLIITGS
jgi:hypothetical protein